VGTPGGVFHTTTAGAEWHPMNAGLSNLDIFDVAIDPQDSNTVYSVIRGSGVFVMHNTPGPR
jgi:hypothetical protein